VATLQNTVCESISSRYAFCPNEVILEIGATVDTAEPKPQGIHAVAEQRFVVREICQVDNHLHLKHWLVVGAAKLRAVASSSSVKDEEGLVEGRLPTEPRRHDVTMIAKKCTTIKEVGESMIRMYYPHLISSNKGYRYSKVYSKSRVQSSE
jgi:hypothetical protein